MIPSIRWIACTIRSPSTLRASIVSYSNFRTHNFRSVLQAALVVNSALEVTLLRNLRGQCESRQYLIPFFFFMMIEEWAIEILTID